MSKKVSLVFLVMFVIVLIPTSRATVSKHVFVITWEDMTFNVVIETTSTIGDFYFTQSLKQVGFQVSGTHGSFGFSNVTIPKSLIWVDNSMEWEVLMDGAKLSPLIFFNGTHTMFRLGYVYVGGTNDITISGTHTVGPEPERKVGVEPGFWIEYNADYNFTTDDPNPPGPPPSPEAFETISFRVEVLSTTGTEIAFLAITQLSNGKEIVANLTIDVATGQGMSYYFIGANLTAGERIYPTPYHPRINSTLIRTYAGAEREVNFLYTWYNGSGSQNHRIETETTMYWDRKTGAMAELASNVKYVELTEGYVTETSIHIFVTRTNIWGQQRVLLGKGVGFVKQGPKQLRFGRAELYKIGDEQIELIITRHGERHSITWTVIRHVEFRNHEWYFCRSPENGALIVKLQCSRRAFWLAVGKSVIAYGPLKQTGTVNFWKE